MSVLVKNALNDSSMSLTAVSEEEKREKEKEREGREGGGEGSAERSVCIFLLESSIH